MKAEGGARCGRNALAAQEHFRVALGISEIAHRIHKHRADHRARRRPEGVILPDSRDVAVLPAHIILLGQDPRKLEVLREGFVNEVFRDIERRRRTGAQRGPVWVALRQRVIIGESGFSVRDRRFLAEYREYEVHVGAHLGGEGRHEVVQAGSHRRERDILSFAGQHVQTHKPVVGLADPVAFPATGE